MAPKLGNYIESNMESSKTLWLHESDLDLLLNYILEIKNEIYKDGIEIPIIMLQNLSE